MIDALSGALLNHLLRSNGWAREALQRHAGKTVCFRCLPFENRLTICAGGEVTPAARDAATDLTLTLTPAFIMRAAARDESLWREVAIEGDTALGTVIHRLWRDLRWDAEEDLSKLFGDIAAHRMAESGRTLQRWMKSGGDNLARSFAEYLTEEQPLIAAKSDLSSFNTEVDRLRDDIARIDKRIEKLAAR